jgi:hypothetical protein
VVTTRFRSSFFPTWSVSSISTSSSLKTQLHKGVGRLPVHTRRNLVPSNAVGKSGNVDDALVGVVELRLATGRVFRLDH